MASLVGRTLGGKYKIRRLLGQGGMATVYLGFQEDLERQVAVKVLPPHPGLNAMFIERFQLEAKTVARLQHPHILQLFDYGVEDDILYLIIPYISGGSLEEVMRDGKLDQNFVEKVLREISGALDFAHRQGVVHRDLKPGNILLDADGNALLADFGIAKITGDSGNLTGTGVVGTPAYMSPEQCQGLQIDSRSDIYALGVVIYEMLTGATPYQADTPVQVMMKHVYDPAPDILTVSTTLPPAVGAVMLKVLAKEPNERYQTATAFAKDLSAALHGGLLEMDLPVASTRNLEASPTPGSSTSPVPGIDRTRAGMTQGGSQTASGMPTGYDPSSSTQQPTIIVQQSGNTGILIAGFALIALLIVGIGAIILIAFRPVEAPPSDEGAFIGLLRDRIEEGTLSPEMLRTAAAILPDVINGDDRTLIAAVLSRAEPTTTPSLTPPPAAQVENSSVVGRATFGLTENPGDSINVRLARVQPPGQGRVYVAWLGNAQTDEHLNLGRIAIDASGEGAVGYIDSEGGFLPALYNTIIITVEEIANESADTPHGNAVFRGGFPSVINTGLSELFVSSENGFNGRGLLQSAAQEARFGQQHAGLASGASNVVGMYTHAEHTLQILIGGEEDYDGNGRVGNPGTGIGLYTYLDRILAVIDEIGASPEVSASTLGEIDNMRVCLDNVRAWTDETVELERAIVAADSIEAVAEQLERSTQVAGWLIDGYDQNENGFVESSEGECGLFQAGASALLIANIEISAMDSAETE